MKAWSIPTVYTASYWHRDCDPIGCAIGTDKDAVETAVRAGMEEERVNVIGDCQCIDCESHDETCDVDPHCDCDCCEDTLRWGGSAFPESLLEYMRDLERWQRENVIAAMRSGDVAWI